MCMNPVDDVYGWWPVSTQSYIDTRLLKVRTGCDRFAKDVRKSAPDSDTGV